MYNHHFMEKFANEKWHKFTLEERIRFYFLLKFQEDLIRIAFSKLSNEPGIGIDRTYISDRDSMVEFRDQLKAISPKLGALYELRNFAKTEEDFINLMREIGVLVEDINNPYDPPF